MPLAMKRPAASMSGRGRGGATESPLLKKTAVASGVSGHINILCNQVACAILTAPEYPELVKQMLTNTLGETLAVPKERRHAFQDDAIEMVRKVLDSLKAAALSKLEGAEEKLATAVKENEKCQSEVESAAAVVAERIQTMVAAKTKHVERTSARVAAKEALALAEREQASGNAGIVVTERKKQRLESCLETIYGPLKSGEMPAAEVRDGAKTIQNLGKDLDFDMSLLQTVPTALAKAPSDRGSFDNVVISQIDAEFQKCLAKFTDELANGEPAKKERAAKVEAASNEHAQALASEEAANTAKEAARTAHKEAETEHTAQLKAQQQSASDRDIASGVVDAARAELTEFDEGPFAAFKELLEFTEIPPPAAVPEPAADARAPAADIQLPEADVADATSA